MPKHDPSPDALALAAEWWRVEEMDGHILDLCMGTPYVVRWQMQDEEGRWGDEQSFGSTPAAAIIAAHEEWKKEQGK